MIRNIRKRDGRVVKFDAGKITEAIFKAAQSVGGKDRKTAEKLSAKVLAYLNKESKEKKGAVPDVEHVQDVVEKVLIESGHARTAKAYILYRQEHKIIRDEDLRLSFNAAKVLEKRYLKKDENGIPSESPIALFRRVAQNIAGGDAAYKGDVRSIEKEFYRLMTSFDFLPNSPTLMNAGRELQQLAACFVLPIDDSIESIFETIKQTCIIHKTGGGTGFSFSKIRPKNSLVKSTYGVASGPVSFMKVFDSATEAVKQGGTRRGANMGILRVDHPDIMEFISCKENGVDLQNFNISVAVTEEFMKAVEEGRDYDLVDPHTKKPAARMSAKKVFDAITHLAWKTGDPGIIFIDRLNADNPTPSIGEIESTNPCGEQPLLPFESCNLGSINLSKMVRDGQIDWLKLEKTTRAAIHFLDNVIDVGKYPLPQIDKMVRANRKIGLGVMGFADMLIQLGIPYDSQEAVETGEKVMDFIDKESKKASVALAEERKNFPNHQHSVMPEKGIKTMRNATTTTIAPTGTISIIANCSSGIEPLFAISFMREVMDGTQLLEVNPWFEKIAMKNGFYSEELMRKIAEKGTVKGMPEVPKDIQRVFVTAHDITPEWHVRMQAAFQKHVDNAVSKTVNFPHDASVEDVADTYRLAYSLGCKGITIYRDGSKGKQVLYVGHSKKEKEKETAQKHESNNVVPIEYSGGCKTCSN